jgi:RNA polymerase sigma-70 factor (ECF subfamily)
MAAESQETEELLLRSLHGDGAARDELFKLSVDRLRRMIAVRLDHRLQARISASDVIQEVLLEASQKLEDYMRERPMPFYPWLRQMTWQRLVKLRKFHRAGKRSVDREARLDDVNLTEDSLLPMARQLAGSASNVSQRLSHKESLERLRAALTQLREPDREILVLRFLEGLSPGEIAAILGITEPAAKTRQGRALLRLQMLLTEEN